MADISIGMWLLSVGTGIGMLWAKDEVEFRLRRKRRRQAFWHLFRHYTPLKDIAQGLIDLAHLVADGDSDALAPPPAHFDPSGDLIAELITTDHRNAAAYLRLKAEDAALELAHANVLSRASAYVRADKTTHRNLVVALADLLGCLEEASRARLQVLRVLQDCEKDADERRQVIAAAEGDTKNWDQIVAAMQEAAARLGIVRTAVDRPRVGGN